MGHQRQQQQCCVCVIDYFSSHIFFFSACSPEDYSVMFTFRSQGGTSLFSCAISKQFNTFFVAILYGGRKVGKVATEKIFIFQQQKQNQ